MGLTLIMTAILTSDLTTGIFSDVMQTVKLNLDEQYAAGRITGEEYVYIVAEIKQPALKQSSIFILGRQKADKQAELLVESKTLTDAQTLKFASQVKEKVLKIMHEGYAVNLSVAGVGNIPETDQDDAIDDLTQELLIDISSDVIIGSDNTPGNLGRGPFIEVIPRGLVSSATNNDNIWIHDKFTSTILEIFSAGPTTTGLTNDGTNLISCDRALIRISIHEGFSESIPTYFAPPYGYPTGVTMDGENLVSCDAVRGEMYIHVGITSTIGSTYSTIVGFYGLTSSADGSDLVAASSDHDKIYTHSGFTGTVSSSIPSPYTSPKGVTNDGTNLISCDYSSSTIYIHSGYSTTITDSFPSPGAQPEGLTTKPPYEICSYD